MTLMIIPSLCPAGFFCFLVCCIIKYMAENVNQLESDIIQLEHDLAAKRAALEQGKESGEIQELPPEKEILRQVIGEKINSLTPPPSDNTTPPTQTPPPAVDMPAYLAPELKDQVQQLIDIAFSKSIADAIHQARATDNAALIDAFHDVLVDALFNHLTERKKLKQL